MGDFRTRKTYARASADEVIRWHDQASFAQPSKGRSRWEIRQGAQLIEFDRSNFRLCAEYYTALLREFKKKKAECGVLWFFVNSGGG
jgi:hypothetical protein